MLTSIIALLFLTLAVAGASAAFSHRSENCWPVCFCAVGCVLYGFYCLGAVPWGLVFVCAGAGALFLAGWKKCGLKSCFRSFFTPGTAVYLCFCLIFLVFFSGNVVSRHDELRLWGAVPKAIHETGKLQLGKDSPIFSIMQSYPPGLPLIGYYFTAFTKSFSEGGLFVGYACMALSFFLPAFSRFQWKHWRLLAPAGLLVLMTPFVFTSHLEDMAMFGMTLFVDPLLGIMAGYAFYLAGHHPANTRFRLLAFSLSLGMLCLLKDTGLLFAAAALLTAVLLDRNSWKRFLIPAVIVLASTLSWKLLLTIYDVHVLVPLKLHALSARATGNVLRALVSSNVLAYKLPLGFFLSFVFVSMVLWLLYFLAFRFRREQSRGEAAAVAAGILLSTIAFIYGYALIYGETLESYARYMTTALLELFTCILLTFLPALPEGRLMAWSQNWKKSVSTMLLSACLLAGIGVTAVWKYVFPLIPEQKNADLEAKRIQAAVESDLEPGQTGWIYLVMAGDGWENSLYHHRVFFDLLSSNINIRNGLAQTQVVLPCLEHPAESWAEELKDGYDYVYLVSVEDAFLPVFQEFSEDTPQEHGLYRVVYAEGGLGVRLESVE